MYEDIPAELHDMLGDGFNPQPPPEACILFPCHTLPADKRYFDPLLAAPESPSASPSLRQEI